MASHRCLQVMQPDYLVVIEEPDTGTANTRQTNVNTSSGDTAMLGPDPHRPADRRSDQRESGGRCGQLAVELPEFHLGFLTQPIDFIDFHIYPINDSFLPNAMQIVAMATAAGKPVSMTEAWMHKERDTEVNVLSAESVQGSRSF